MPKNRLRRFVEIPVASFRLRKKLSVTPPKVPFGGYKQSGLGRENGLQAIEHFTQVKTVYVNLRDVPERF
jgi:betaine-aldehyde dehydrogenase